MLSARWLVRPKQRLPRQRTALSFHSTHHYAAIRSHTQPAQPRSSLASSFIPVLFSAFSCIFLILSVGHLQLDWAAPAHSGARSVPLRVDSPRDCAGLCASVLPFSRRSASPIRSFSPPFPSHSLPSSALFVYVCVTSSVATLKIPNLEQLVGSWSDLRESKYVVCMDLNGQACSVARQGPRARSSGPEAGGRRWRVYEAYRSM